MNTSKAVSEWEAKAEELIVEFACGCAAQYAGKGPSGDDTPDKLITLRAHLRTHPATEAESPIKSVTQDIRATDTPIDGDGLVGWEYRHWSEHNHPPGWGAWERVTPRYVHTDTVEDRVQEIQAYIASGYKYELRALYTRPALSPADSAGDVLRDDTFPEGWHSAAVKPGSPGWYERKYSDGTYAHWWSGEIWSSTKDGNAHWRQLADAPYPLWRAVCRARSLAAPKEMTS